MDSVLDNWSHIFILLIRDFFHDSLSISLVIELGKNILRNNTFFSPTSIEQSTFVVISNYVLFLFNIIFGGSFSNMTWIFQTHLFLLLTRKYVWRHYICNDIQYNKQFNNIITREIKRLEIYDIRNLKNKNK
jgi:hypothetical protein